MKGSRIMDAWFNEQWDENTTFISSSTGVSNNTIGLYFLQHLINVTNASPFSKHKILLYDGYDSHCTDEFKHMAINNNIILFQFSSYLTYLMQPLDVGVFQTYKHYQKIAVHKAICSLESNYNSASFCRDIPAIRKQTLTPDLIKSAWKKAGCWPVNAQVVLKKMKEIDPPELPKLPYIEDKDFLSSTP